MIAEKKSLAGPESYAALRRAERSRVNDIIARDRIDAQRERDRKAAEIQLENGQTASIAETVIEPTPEWMAKGETMPFTPKQHENTVRVIRTVRRVESRAAKRLHADGKLTDDQYAACIWYRRKFEEAGLEGRFSASGYSLTAGCSSGGGGGSFWPMARHESEAQARQEFRAARDALEAHTVGFFEMIVVGNVGMREATRYARCRNDLAPLKFRAIAQRLYNHLARVKASFVSDETSD